MPTRIVREGINSSQKVNSLSPGAELLYRRLISVVDDYGRFYASAATVRGACWPGHPDNVTEKEIKCWLEECASEPDALIVRYQVQGVWFLQIEKFGQKVRSRSKFPSPDGIVQPTGEGSIYFIRSMSSGRIKIGFTELSPASRLATLQTGSADALELIGSFRGCMADERAAHQSLSIHRLAGEWFEPSAEVCGFIAEKCGEMPQPASKMPQIVSTSRSRNSESKTESNKTPVAKPATVVDEISDWFIAEFWPLYPRHTAKAEGLKAARAKLKTPADRAAAMKGLRSQVQELRSREESKIPHPATWINGRRWEDEAPQLFRQSTPQPQGPAYQPWVDKFAHLEVSK